MSVVTGNKQKWVPLMIEVKSEGPRERSASRNNSRQNENPRLPPNARNDLRGQSDVITLHWHHCQPQRGSVCSGKVLPGTHGVCHSAACQGEKKSFRNGFEILSCWFYLKL